MQMLLRKLPTNAVKSVSNNHLQFLTDYICFLINCFHAVSLIALELHPRFAFTSQSNVL